MVQDGRNGHQERRIVDVFEDRRKDNVVARRKKMMPVRPPALPDGLIGVVAGFDLHVRNKPGGLP